MARAVDESVAVVSVSGEIVAEASVHSQGVGLAD